MENNEQKIDLSKSETIPDGYVHEESGAIWNAGERKWKGYRPQKGVTPPWAPFSAKRKKRLTIRERKFLMVLSTTGSLSGAYRAAYTIGQYDDKALERARVLSMANTILRRIREKAPELVEAFLFEDITPEFVRKEMLKLYNSDNATIAEKTRLLELMGKTQAMFTDKSVVNTTVKGVIDTIYDEAGEDFPEIPIPDARLGRQDIQPGAILESLDEGKVVLTPERIDEV